MSSRIWTLAAVLAATAPAACASAPKPRFEDPAWFTQRRAELKRAPYPDLHAVPKAQAAARPDAEWRDIREDLRAAGEAVLSSGRNAPADVSDLSEFENKARAAAKAEPAAPVDQ